MTVALSTLMTSLCGADGDQGVIQDSSYYGASGATIKAWINKSVKTIAAGIKMPNNGPISPPLPDLVSDDTVDTATDASYKAMPTTYQRHVFMVADSNGTQLFPPEGGGYYDFGQFMKRASKKDLSEEGSIHMVCIHGRRFYYQGRPTAAQTVTIHFYRYPVDMASAEDTVDGLPDHLAERLIKHWVCKEIFGEGIEDGDDSRMSGAKYHEGKFYEALQELIDFVETQNVAYEYFGSDDGEP